MLNVIYTGLIAVLLNIVYFLFKRKEAQSDKTIKKASSLSGDAKYDLVESWLREQRRKPRK